MRLDKLSFAQLLVVEPILEAESKEALVKVGKPRKVCGKVLPDDLNGISLGELFDLQGAVKSDNSATIIGELARILLGVAPSKVMRSRADEALGFMLWACRELERIGKMWQMVSPPPSPEAVQAGVDKLDFGEFGTVDWYAQRMGISNHDEVLRVPWLRIYMCLDMDNKRAQFQERLREIMSKQQTKR